MVKDSDDGFSRGSGEIDVGCVGIGEEGCDAVKAAEATLDVTNLIGVEVHRSLRDWCGKTG